MKSDLKEKLKVNFESQGDPQGGLSQKECSEDLGEALPDKMGMTTQIWISGQQRIIFSISMSYVMFGTYLCWKNTLTVWNVTLTGCPVFPFGNSGHKPHGASSPEQLQAPHAVTPGMAAGSGSSNVITEQEILWQGTPQTCWQSDGPNQLLF